MPSGAREAALNVLLRIHGEGAYLNIALEQQLGISAMDQRDSALCSRIVMGVERHRLYIDNIIKNLSRIKLGKLSPEILDILRVGVYSIKFSDKIPVRATVDECVKLAKRHGGQRSGGFVNAVLRRAAESGDFLEGLSGDKLLSVKYSMPLWLVEKWKKEQKNYEKLIEAMSLEPKTYCRLNCGFLPDGFVKNEITPYLAEYIGSGSVTASQAYREGLVTVQDSSSQLCVMAMDIKKGDKTLDLCAAPGGKSVFAAYLGGQVTACDLYENKIELIKANARRLNVGLDAFKSDALEPREEFKEKFDVVLADAPCSGLGIIRRKPDIKWNKTPLCGEELAKIQQGILDNAAEYVKRGGRLIYSTCTVSKAENEGIFKWFLKKHPEFSPSPLNIPFCEEGSNIQLRPDMHGTDGFFIAKAVKLGDA